MIPRRYLIASLFIAAMLLLLAIVQAPRSAREGGILGDTPVALTLDSFETLTEFRLQDGWSPRFQDTRDPDQHEPWPFEGGFETPWEPASPYLADQGVALNGPEGRSEVVLWRGLEWRRYRFELPLVSARLEPQRASRLLVTLALGQGRFETRLLEVPEGRVLWTTDSGPWSRFSWDGRAVLVGLPAPSPAEGLLLTTLPLDGPLPQATLAPWNEAGLPSPPKGWPVRGEQLWDQGADLPGPKLLIPWPEDGRLWFSRSDRLWVCGDGQWALWGLENGVWARLAAGEGVLSAHPPLRIGRVALAPQGPVRETTNPNEATWTALPPTAAPWPAFDPAWTWGAPESAFTAWDQRWGKALPSLTVERQREALKRAFRGEWRTATRLRASVGGWLPVGPEVALREGWGVAWVWVGDRILLVRLQGLERLRAIQHALRAR